MSEIDQEDRTEQPTEKRLKDARQKGQIPRSKELANVAVMGSGAVAVLMFAPSIGRGAREWLRAALTLDPAMIDAPELLVGHFGLLLLRLLLIASPIMLVALAACFVSPLIMGGLQFSSEVLQPKFDRMSPLAGLKRMYGKEAMVELLKSVLRILIVGGVGWIVVRGSVDEFMRIPRMDLAEAASMGTGAVGHALMLIISAMGVLALLDIPWQHLAHIKKLRMTKQEIKEEFKESEGNPEMKGRVRQVQRQLANQRMMEAVPSADVVIVNPTHYSVALKYDTKRKNSAPVVVAKGVDELALRIRELAQQNRVALVEAPPLARVLYRQAKVGSEIPVDLYNAVAQVLTYVYQLQRWHPSRGPRPQLAPIHVDEKPEA